ncbi:MAG: RNA methyltransferase [Bacteroidales bacterium]|nr:RNA methyltransferase [Bacteroidales bacterium]
MEISKADIKLINALSKSHGRKKYHAFLVEGVKMVNEVLNSDIKIQLIAATKEWLQGNPQFEKQENFRLITERELKKISNFSTSNQVMVVAQKPDEVDLKLEDDELVLVLDTVQDPGNMGTIIRTADWYGINKIICSPETVDAYSSKVVQSSMGSVFRSRVYYTNIVELLQKYDKPIYGSLLSGDNIYHLNLKADGFIIIGNESKGISPQVQKLITQAIYIPSYKDSKAESLNAAIACGIILSEFNRSL